MNIKDTLPYKLIKSAYLKYMHITCDLRRKPLINPLKNKLLNLDSGK